ncbi:hypothetical protein HLY00_2214 [Mycolicibacterium hippocampi]|uniref:Uncharacterized protein n=1 Tax=Mycolicibacterium hippocampi TaxID=659824 RepID=A0A850PWT1_9MYCO|nr:hypothetical protein [Mycolicibacterium hippocampi]
MIEALCEVRLHRGRRGSKTFDLDTFSSTGGAEVSRRVACQSRVVVLHLNMFRLANTSASRLQSH